jgi:hypothetical protein
MKLEVITLDEAQRQLCVLFGVSGRSELLTNFCTCKKPWGVGGRCVACEKPIKIG